jgi:hypothetical protein
MSYLQLCLSTKVRKIAAMLKAIHAGEDTVVQVIEKQRALRLIKTAELVVTCGDVAP